MIERSEFTGPVAPPRSGAAVMQWLFVIAALVTGVIAGLAVLGGAVHVLAHSVGLAVEDDVRAQVVEREFKPVYWSRVSNCDFYRFTVRWSGGSGHFTVCEGRPLSRLQVGDTVEVHPVPWVDEVLVEGEPDRFWLLAGLVLGGLGFAASTRAAWRYRRLRRVGAGGPCLPGAVAKVTKNAMTVTFEGPSRELVMLPAGARQPFTASDRVQVWAARRSRWRKRPRGPWLVQGRGVSHVYTHAWWR